MLIERANPSHLDALTRLALKLWPDNTWENLRAEFEELLESEKDACFLASVEGEYVGFVHMCIRSDYVEGSSSSPVGYVEGIYVEEHFRHRGLGRMLIEAGEQWSKSKGCAEIASDTALENVDSQAFHKKMGFREAARIVAFIKAIE